MNGSTRYKTQEHAHRTHLSVSCEQATPIIGVLALLLSCVLLSAGARLRPRHVPMGSDGDGHDYESLATLVTVAIAPFAKHKDTHYYYYYYYYYYDSERAANSCEYVRGRGIAVVGWLIFARTLLKKTLCKFGLHSKGRRSDSTRLILPSKNQASFLFRIRAMIRDGLKERCSVSKGMCGQR